jgi:hypothetical protein
MYSVPPKRWWPVSRRQPASSPQATPITGAAIAWLESNRRLPAISATAVTITPRLQRKRKLAKP